MSATNKGLIWKGDVAIGESGFLYRVNTDGVAVMHPETFGFTMQTTKENGKEYAEAHEKAVQIAIDFNVSKHRLDAENLAALVAEYQCFVMTDQSSFPGILKRIEEALKAHDEVIE